jgi:hypothetical protein
MKYLKVLLFSLLMLMSVAAIASEKEKELDRLLGITPILVPLPDIGPAGSTSQFSAPQAYCTPIGLDICFNKYNRALLIPGGRKLLPVIPGLHAERFVIKRDGLFFQYSF